HRRLVLLRQRAVLLEKRVVPYLVERLLQHVAVRVSLLKRRAAAERDVAAIRDAEVLAPEEGAVELPIRIAPRKVVRREGLTAHAQRFHALRRRIQFP